MPLAESSEHVRLLGDEIQRLGEMYRIAFDAQVLRQAGRAEGGLPCPRPEDLIRPRTGSFKAMALQYLEAVRPNDASFANIDGYVRRWVGDGYSASACSQAMSELVKAKLARKEGARGRWKATAKFGNKAPQADPRALPEINAPGLLAEVRRVLLAHGPQSTAQLIDHLLAFFSIGGQDPVVNFQTIVGRVPDIRHCGGVGWIPDDFARLEPALRARLRSRRPR